MDIDFAAITAALSDMDKQDTGHDDDSREDSQSTDVDAQNASSESEQVGDSQTSGKKESSHVPYDRFKSVVDEKNSLRSEMEALRKQVEGLTSSRARDEEEDLSFLDDSDSDPAADPEMRFSRADLEQEQVKLQKEVDTVISEYPGVPPEILYLAVAKDPTVDLNVVANGYHLYVSDIENKAIERFKQTSAKEAPPPHTKRAGDGKFQTSSKPRTLEEAHAAMAKLLAGS